MQSERGHSASRVTRILCRANASLSLRLRVSAHPTTCAHVRLLGPCFKTGRVGGRLVRRHVRSSAQRKRPPRGRLRASTLYRRNDKPPNASAQTVHKLTPAAHVRHQRPITTARTASSNANDRPATRDCQRYSNEMQRPTSPALR